MKHQWSGMKQWPLINQKRAALGELANFALQKDSD
jgi:hypothetical protein